MIWAMTEPRFSCQEQLVPGNTYADKFAFLARAGFAGIEIWSQNLSDHIAELAELSVSTGIAVSSGCQGFDGGLINASEAGRRAAITQTREALDALGALNGAGFVVPSGFALGSKVLPPFKPPRPAEEDAEALRDSLAQILPHAAQTQVAVFLEPINRYEIHFLNSLAEAASVVSAINSPWLSVVADLFHMNIEEANPIEALSNVSSWLGHVHLADTNRKLPGQGHLNFVAHFTVLQRSGYRAWLAIECDRPADGPRELPAAIDYLRDCWSEAERLT
jgi:sugar phosphate isomerase/epimerase